MNQSIPSRSDAAGLVSLDDARTVFDVPAESILRLWEAVKCAPGVRPRDANAYGSPGEPFRSARHGCSYSAGVK
jgi:hypothetical protein